MRSHDGWMVDGWTNGQMDGWMEGIKNKQSADREKLTYIK